MQCREEKDACKDDQNNQTSSKDDDGKVGSSSSTSDDEAKSDSPRTRNQRLYAERGQLKRRLADSRERASQLELQLAKTRSLLDAANRRLAAVDDAGIPLGDGEEGRAGARRGKDKRNISVERLRDAQRRLHEAEKARCELEHRLSTVLCELALTQESRQKMADELSACNRELDNARRRMTSGRDFRRHVELTRQLNEARKLNEQLQWKFGGGRRVAMLNADGTLQRQTSGGWR